MRVLHDQEARDLVSNVDEKPVRPLASLIVFMEAFHLRFGIAETPRQRAAYQQLYPLLDRIRKAIANQEAEEQSAAETSKAGTQPLTDFFDKLPDAQVFPGTPEAKP